MSLDSESANQTLAVRLAQGSLPVQEALRYSMILAQALRSLHETGCAHGAVSPSSIVLTRTGLELLPATSAPGEITPYTAPELIEGRPADSRSDIFSFGAILYELLVGRPAFSGESPEMLAAALARSSFPPSGSSVVDRLVATCIAKDPAGRVQRIQKLILELKLLAVAVRHAAGPAPGREEIPRAELEQLEARITVRLDRIEQSLGSFAERFTALDRGFQDAGPRWEAIEHRVSVMEHFEPRVVSLERAVKTTAGLIRRLEQAVESLTQESARGRDESARASKKLEEALKAQSVAIESARTAIAQTDDLVERVVEALESLQTSAVGPDQLPAIN